MDFLQLITSTVSGLTIEQFHTQLVQDINSQEYNNQKDELTQEKRLELLKIDNEIKRKNGVRAQKPPMYQIRESSKCTRECVGENKFFCLALDRNSGVCSTKLPDQSDNQCSYKSNAPSLKY